jgi:hypothetical protein
MRANEIGAAGAVLAIVGVMACSQAPSLPADVTFDQVSLVSAASWSRGRLSGSVYVRPGQTLPAAPLQVGVIVSHEHTTAKDLHAWIRDQALRSGTPQFHQSGTNDESCTVGVTPGRTYMALEVCKTGVERAACVEADEEIDGGTFASCLNDSCFQDVCDARWLERREALDLLAADILSKR